MEQEQDWAIGITGSGFTAIEEGSGVNGGGSFRMLLATTR